MAPVGPQLPDTIHEKRKRDIIEDDDSGSESESSAGPLPPPSVELPAKKARVIGPTLPPTIGATATQERTRPAPAAADPIPEGHGGSGEEESEDDDDDYGPSLPSNGLSAASKSGHTNTIGTATTENTTAAVKRDDWMMVPPSSGDWSSRIDPTKLKNRKFNSGKGSKAPSAPGNAADTWHETPAEKQARLQREMMGIKSNASDDNHNIEATAKRVDAETKKRMAEYNKMRGPALYESHQGKQTEKEDDPSARAFDRDKDIGGGLQINSTQRRDMLKKASDFGSRFSTAKYL